MADGGHITLADLPPEISRQSAAPKDIDVFAGKGGDLRDQLRWIEAGIIAKAIDEADGDRKLAAQRLGIGLSSLYRKLEELADIRSQA